MEVDDWLKVWWWVGGLVYLRVKWTLWHGSLEDIQHRWGIFSRHNWLVLGDGSRLRFWNDLWCGTIALKTSFMSVFRLACEKEGFVTYLLERSRDQTHWNIIFSRATQDWEVENFEEFFSFHYSLNMHIQGSDMLCWVPIEKEKFSVR